MSDGTFHRKQEAVGGAYEGASRTSSEIASWQPSNRSVDQEINLNKSIIDGRSKDVARNDGYISGAVNTHKDSIVGSQFVLNAKPDLNILSLADSRFDESWLTEYQQSVESQFTLWGESPESYIDAQRINTFTSLVRLAVGVGVFTGEVLASSEWIKSDSPFNTAIQMIDTDRLSNPNHNVDTPTLSGGIKKNRFGAPLSYFIREGHPGDFNNPDSYKWREIKAKKRWGRRQIIHIYEQQRPSQTRAVSDLVSVLKQIKMTNNFQDVVLQNAVMNASFAATIESELPPELTFQQLGAGDEEGGAAQNYMSQVADYMGSSNNIKIDGAKIPHLWPGQKLNLQSAANPGGVGDKFEQSLLRHIASALGLSYEQFARDYTQTNYSSARASMGETHKFMMSRKKTFADKFASHIYQLWFEEALNKGGIPMPSGVGSSFFYQGLNKDALTACSWLGASAYQIDPLKETKAAIMRINAGLSTRELENARLGNDYRDVFNQLQREDGLMESKGLLLNMGESNETNVEEQKNA